MPIHRLPIGPLGANCYIIENKQDAIIVDPPEDADKVFDFLEENNLKVQAIFCTHLHFDHISGVNIFKEKTNAPIYAGQGDIDMKEMFLSSAMTFGMPPVDDFEAIPLTEGEHTFGTLSCKVITTPGHSPGGLCFYFENEKSLISGDTLFRRSVGRADFPGGDVHALIASIQEKLFNLPDETIVYPGHDRPTTIIEEKTQNPFF